MGLSHRLTVAEAIGPLATKLVGGALPLRIEFWDGSCVGPEGHAGVENAAHPLRDALVRLLWRPDELGLARAYIAGDLEAEGDLCELLAVMLPIVRHGTRLGWSALPAGLRRRGAGRAAAAAAARPARGGPAVGGGTRCAVMPPPSATTTTSATISTGWCSGHR